MFSIFFMFSLFSIFSQLTPCSFIQEQFVEPCCSYISYILLSTWHIFVISCFQKERPLLEGAFAIHWSLNDFWVTSSQFYVPCKTFNTKSRCDWKSTITFSPAVYPQKIYLEEGISVSAHTGVSALRCPTHVLVSARLTGTGTSSS